MKKLGLLSLVFLLLSGCYTVPETGRSAINLMPENMLTSMASSSFQQMKSQGTISTDQEGKARVERVGRRIVQQIGASGNLPSAHQWEFVLFEDDEMINAFAMPGGKVGVYTGLLKLTEGNDDELAAVMGHEIGHVAARHGNERFSQSMIIAAGGVAAGYATRNKSEETRRAVMIAYGLGSTIGAALPFSRLHENEADRMGIMYMARAGYDPRASITFWQKMAEKSAGKAPPEFLSTHPAAQTRIQNLKNLMPQALAEYNRYKR